MVALTTEFLDAKQKYAEERDENRESASTSITVTHYEVDEKLCSVLVRETLAELKRAVLSALSL
jgi:hypothetical protein